MIAMRTSAFSAAHCAVGGTQSSCSSLASSKNAAWAPSVESCRTAGRPRAGPPRRPPAPAPRRGWWIGSRRRPLRRPWWSSGRGSGRAPRRGCPSCRHARVVEQPAVQPALVGQLGVEGDGEHVALADGDGMAVDLREHLDVVAVLLDPGRADEDRVQRLAAESRSASKSRAGARRRCAARSRRAAPRWSRSSMIRPAQVPSAGGRCARTAAAARPAPRARCRASWSSTRRPG